MTDYFGYDVTLVMNITGASQDFAQLPHFARAEFLCATRHCAGCLCAQTSTTRSLSAVPPVA